MKTIIYTDDDSTLDIGSLPKKSKKLVIGSVVKINGESYEVWYIEEVGNTHRNVRVQRC